MACTDSFRLAYIRNSYFGAESRESQRQDIAIRDDVVVCQGQL